MPKRCYSSKNGSFEHTLLFNKWFHDETNVTVNFYLTNQCSLWVSIKLDGYLLTFPNEMEWSF
uniref:Uncharacterized protein n=1 Tax=Romanomermis culicivorax TaxID=13658 RepID=A0A915KJL8_ROMCU